MATCMWHGGYFSAEDLPRVRECLKRPGQGWPPLALNAKMCLVAPPRKEAAQIG